jgi:hypothetical protein
MSKTFNLQQQLSHFDETGIFPDSDGSTSCYGFYDWFCSNKSLERRSRSLVAKLKKFLKVNPTIDLTQHYVFFKNNCPMCGPTYDDFRICDITSGEVRYTVVPKCSHSGKAEIWGRTPDGKFSCLGSRDTYKELINS